MKNKKNVFYALIVPLLVVSGLVFADREISDRPSEKTSSKSSPVADRKAGGEARKIWENTPDGIKFRLWENSAEGQKVNASRDKIKTHLKTFASMEAVVTSFSFRSDANGPKWIIVRINGEQYMMQYSTVDFQKLSSLKVNDKIIVKSHSAGRSPNHPYLVLSGDYIERNNKVLFQREFNKNNGC